MSCKKHPLATVDKNQSLLKSYVHVHIVIKFIRPEQNFFDKFMHDNVVVFTDIHITAVLFGYKWAMKMFSGKRTISPSDFMV